MKGFDYEEAREEKSVPKEAHRERKHHVEEKRQAGATKRQQEKRVLAAEHSVGFQGRCVLNPEGADPAKYRR